MMKCGSSGCVVCCAVLELLGVACSDRPSDAVPDQAGASELPQLERVRSVADPAARSVSAGRIRDALGPRLDRSRHGLTIERTAAGSQRIDLKGRFRSAHVLTIDEAGNQHVECVTTKGELEQVLARGGRR